MAAASPISNHSSWPRRGVRRGRYRPPDVLPDASRGPAREQNSSRDRRARRQDLVPPVLVDDAVRDRGERPPDPGPRSRAGPGNSGTSSLDRDIRSARASSYVTGCRRQVGQRAHEPVPALDPPTAVHRQRPGDAAAGHGRRERRLVCREAVDLLQHGREHGRARSA